MPEPVGGSLCRPSQPTNGCFPLMASQSNLCHQIPYWLGWKSPTSYFHCHQPCCPPLVPTVRDKLLVLGLFIHILSSTRIMFFPHDDHMRRSGLRVVDSAASGKWSFLPRSNSSYHLWPDCRRFCLAWPWTTGLWPSCTKVTVLSSVFASAGSFLLLPSSRMSASTANTLSWRHLYLPLGHCYSAPW